MSRPLDAHNHLKGWSDGTQTLPELVALAAERGVRLGVADHAGSAGPMGSEARLLEYADFLSQHAVARGIEMDLDRPLSLGTDTRGRFDYVIGSVHGLTVDGRRLCFSDIFAAVVGGKPAGGMLKDLPGEEAFFSAHLRLLDAEFSRQRYDILGHCSFLPPFILRPSPAKGPSWWEDGLVELLVRHGVAVELSNRWKTPYRGLMARCVRAGLTFSLGSDGHNADQSCRLDYPMALVSEFRVPEERLFDVRRAGL